MGQRMVDPTVPTIDFERIERAGIYLKDLIKYQNHLSKRVHPLIEKFGVYNVINHINGHCTQADLTSELKAIIDQMGVKPVLGYAEAIKEELLRQQ